MSLVEEIYPAIKLLRPHQWLKNGFVLVGVLFSYTRITSTELESAFYAFVAFCCAASAIYVLNDIKDVESDRRHPKKKNRPLAAGTVSLNSAVGLSISLLFSAFVFAALSSYTVLLFVVSYLAINVAYTLWLKHEVIVDVFCIFAGFMMRLLAGTVGIGIEPSRWLLITGMMITLFLGFCKRRAELSVSSGVETRKILKEYSLPLLDKFIAICAAGTLITYGLYTVDESTIRIHHTENLIWTMPIIAFGIFRYLFLIQNLGKGEDTSKDLLNDVPMLLAVFCWVTSVVVITSYF